jgi:hypothetical protein
MITQRRLFVTCAVVAVVAGMMFACLRSWLCDDAFISFRYADNLVAGHGLVFNAGERVEGDTNFLWTLWCAIGVTLGADPGRWAIAWGVVCFATVIGLLARASWRLAREADVAWPLPLAAIWGALHFEWTVFTTSGLETSAFTLAAFGGYLLASTAPRRDARFSSEGYRRIALAGCVYGVASLIRPDGPAFAAICGAWLLAQRDLRAVLLFGAGFILVWGPPTAWRAAYYGGLFPNTYYAKSASIAWWSQGLYYAQTYFTRYWPVLLAFPVSLLVRPRRTVALELALALGYALYVMRVGGDFMFGRMFVPITPYLLLALERGFVARWPHRPLPRLVAAGALALGLVATPSPVAGLAGGGRGVVDEHAYYTEFKASWARESDEAGARLRRLFDGLPVVVCFYGSEARLVYASHVRTAIECETGLTDEVVAHQPLAKHGRIGHEKRAPWWYLVHRGTHFVFSPVARSVLDLDHRLPTVYVNLSGVRARMLFWDPAVVTALRARGAEIPDVPGLIDREVAALSKLPDAEVRDHWEKLYTFYFSHVDDPDRERPFRERLARVH